MRVSTFVRDLSDTGLRWLKQIGVDDVVLRLEYISEYVETGRIERATLERLVARFRSFGLAIGMVNLSIEHLWDVYFDRPGAARQLENIHYLLPCLAAAQHYSRRGQTEQCPIPSSGKHWRDCGTGRDEDGPDGYRRQG